MAVHLYSINTTLSVSVASQVGEENFKLCFQFAQSNFKFHRYLDVNDLNVSRSVKG